MNGNVKYKWKSQARVLIPADKAGATLEQIRAKYAGLKPEYVVNEAKKKTSPLHSYFDWDNTTAASKWRLEQARYLIRMIEVVYVKESKPDGTDEVCVVRAYHPIERDGEKQYTSVIQIMADPDLRQQLLKQAMAELKAWRKKYDDLKEFSRVFEAMDALTG